MLEDLIARIDELGGEDAYPVVPLDLFFDGNDDPASFAPNLEPHPGIAKIYEVLRSIEPDELSADPADDYCWGEHAGRDRSTPPPGAPDVPSRHQPVTLSWD